MSVTSIDASVQALYDLYWLSSQETKNFILSKLSTIKNANSLIAFLSNTWKNMPSDLTQISQNLDFLCLYTINIKNQISPEIAHALFSIYMQIAKLNPLPSSYENYSKFLAILLPAIKTQGQLSIAEQLKTLDPQTAIFPLAHFSLFYQDHIQEFVSKMLSDVKTKLSITHQSIWNETMCVFLRSKASSSFDRLAVFSAVDYALATQGFTESKVNLLQASFRYFNNQELGQIMRMHFTSLSKKLNANTPNNSQQKLLQLCISYYDICDEKENLLTDTFQYIFPTLPFNSQTKQLICKLCDKIDKNLRQLIIQKMKGMINIFHILMFIASKYPEYDTMSLLIASSNELDGKKDLKQMQYQFLIDLAKSGNFPQEFTIFLFSNLKVDDYDIILEAIHNNQVVYLVHGIRYLQRNIEKQKFLKILKTFASFKKLPILPLKEVTDCVTTLISNYFTMKIDDKEFILFIQYLKECYDLRKKNQQQAQSQQENHDNEDQNEDAQKSNENQTEEEEKQQNSQEKNEDETNSTQHEEENKPLSQENNFKYFTFSDENNQQYDHSYEVYPTFIRLFFSKEENKQWREDLFQCTMERIKRADKQACVTMIALAPDGTAFEHCYLFVRSDPVILSSFFASASLNLENETLAFIYAILTKNGKKKGFAISSLISSIWGSSSNSVPNSPGKGNALSNFDNVLSDAVLIKVVLQTFITIKKIVKPTEDAFNILRILFNADLIYTDFEQLCHVTIEIVKRMEMKEDLTFFIERICDNSNRLSKEIIEDSFCVLLPKNLRLKSNLAERISTVWLNILNSDTYIVEETILEKEFLRKAYFHVTAQIITSQITSKLSQFQSCSNYYQCFKRLTQIETIDKNQLIKQNLPVFIGNVMDKDPTISKISLEMIQDLFNIKTSFEYKYTEHYKEEESNPDIASFFTELSTKLSYDLSDVMRIVKFLLDTNKSRSFAYFFISICKVSGKEILLSHSPVLMSFLSLESLHEKFFNHSITQVLNILNDSNSKLLFNAIISTNAYQLSQSCIRIIIGSPSFESIFFECIDKLSEKKTQMIVVGRLTTFLVYALRETVFHIDSKVIESLLVILALTNLYYKEESNEFIQNHKKQLQEIIILIFTSFKTSYDLITNFKQTPESLFDIFNTIITMTRQIMKDNEITSLSESISKKINTELSCVALPYFSHFVTALPFIEDKDFSTFCCKSLISCYHDKTVTDKDKIVSIQRITSGNSNQLPFIEQLTEDQIEILYQSYSLFLKNAFATDPKQIGMEQMLPYFLIVSRLETEYFHTELDNIIPNINKMLDLDSQITFSEYLLSVFHKYVQIKATPGCFAGTFPKAFIEVVRQLIIRRNRVYMIFSNLTHTEGNEPDIGLFMEEAMPMAGIAYLEAANVAMTTAQTLKSKLDEEDLTILSKIMKPLKEQHSNKQQVIDKYISILKDIYMDDKKPNSTKQLILDLISQTI